jgi:flagellar hook-length control protein FliK
MAAVVQVSGDSLNNQASAGVESSTGTSTTFYQESHFRAMHTVNAEGTQQSSGSMATGVSRENSIPAEAVPIDGNPLITGKEGEAAGTASSMISGAETTASAGALTGVAANDASTMSTTADASKQTAASPGSQQAAASPGSQQAAASSGSQQAAASSGSQQAADKTLVDAAQMARDSADETQAVKTSGNTAESAAAKQNGAAAGAAGKESSIPFKPVMDNAESSDTKVLNDNRNTDSVIPERTRIDTVLSKNTDTSASAGKSPAQKAVEYALGGGEEVSQPYNANTVESAGNTSQGRQTQVVSENGIPVEIAHEQAESEMSGGGNKDSQTADDLPDDVAARLFTGEVDTKNGTDNVFAEKMKMAASPKTEDRMIQSMVREAKFMVEEGLSKADITLDPPDLGKMKIEIVTENSKVTAKLTVESREVQDLVQDNLRQLQEQFAEQGMKIESFDVQVGHNGGSDAWANRERAEQSGITGNGHKTRRPGAIADSEAGIENDSSHRATRSLTSEQLDMLA